MDFATAVSVLVTAFAALAIVTGVRWAESRLWRRELVALRVRLPRDADMDDVSRMLSIVAGSTTRRPIVFEIVGTARGIAHYLLVPETLAPRVVTMMTATLAGVRLEEAPGYLSGRPLVRRARELRIARTWRPLASDRAHAAVAGVLSAMYPLNPAEVVRVQWTLRARGFVRLAGDVPAEMAHDFGVKQSAPLVDACGRVAVSAPHRERAALLLDGVLAGLEPLNAPGAAFSARLMPAWWVARRVYARALPLTVWPCLLNTVEAAALIGVPVGGLTIPGLATGTARQLPAPPDMRAGTGGGGLTVAVSNYPGMVGRPLMLADDDRLRHVLVEGPTGAGKTELIANMVGQDIEAGHGVIVIDPKSDLIAEILARVPDWRADDVIMMDASATENPVGFNLLRSGHSEHARELVVDRTVHVLSQLWRSSWGPRTADVMRNGLLTLTQARAADGSPFTLAELADLLTDSDFRRSVTSSRAIPRPVRQFWAAYEEMTDAERAQVVGPTMNKIRAFTTRSALRLIIGQSGGLDMGEVFRDRKILLVPLAKGVIGPDAAHLIGSLLVAMLWQETLNRASIPPERRYPVFAYIDEFQEFLRFGAGTEIADMLAQARSYGLGLTLAHQYLDQLPPDVAAAVLGTARTQIVFQLEYRDAQTMARRFLPLETSDLSGLDAFEIAMRPCVDSRTISPVTGSTLQLPDPVRDPGGLAAYSLRRYGVPRAHIEAARDMRVNAPPAIPAGTGPEPRQKKSTRGYRKDAES